MPHLPSSSHHVGTIFTNLDTILPQLALSWHLLLHLGTIFGPSWWTMVSNLTPRAYSGPSTFPQLTFQTFLGEWEMDLGYFQAKYLDHLGEFRNTFFFEKNDLRLSLLAAPYIFSCSYMDPLLFISSLKCVEFIEFYCRNSIFP